MTKAHCDCFINQAVNAVVPNELYDEEFVYYVSKYNLGQLNSLDSGTASGRENVSKSSFSSMKLNVPSDKMVKIKIVQILCSYDNLIENNLKRIRLLEELAEHTYKEWLVKFRLNVEILEIDKERELPLGWEEIPIGELIKFQKGKKANTINLEYKEGFEKLLLLDGIESGKYPYTDLTGQVVAKRGDLIMLMDGARSSKFSLLTRGWSAQPFQRFQ